MNELILTVNRILNNWLKENGFNCYVRYDEDFEYDYLNGIINYTLYDETEEDELFLEVCESIYDAEYDDFIISFLHELGHHETRGLVSDQDLIELEQFKYQMNPEDPEAQLQYLVSYPEWEATNWACQYMKNNQEKVKNLQEELQEYRIKFFELMKE